MLLLLLIHAQFIEKSLSSLSQRYQQNANIQAINKILFKLSHYSFFQHIILLKMKSYADGPIALQKRSCTDSICLFLFFLLTFVIFGFAVNSWINGNFKQLTHGYDPDGKGCGVDYPDFPYIYFASPSVDSLWVTVCVSACPVTGDNALKCQPNSVVKSCNPSNSTNNRDRVEIYDSAITAGTLCLPSSKYLQETISEALGSHSKQIVTLMQNYTLILISLPIAIILALIIMILIRCLAQCFIYILILATIGALVGIGTYILIGDHSDTPGGALSLVENPVWKVIIAIGCYILAGLILTVMCCFRSRLALASKVIEVAAVFVGENCVVILIPFIMFLVTILFIALWILQALGFYSMGKPIHAPQQYPYQHFQVSKQIYALMVVHLFYLFWGVFFLIETSGFLIIGTAASWYYKRESPYSQTSERYRWKHMGSVCMGAFFKALIGFLKFMYELLTPEEAKDQNSILYKYKKCCDCICCICIKIFDWLNMGAYTVVNVVGDSYCDSAIKAASLRINNLASSAILTVLQTVFTIIVRVGITALTILAIYIIGTNVEKYSIAMEDPTLLLIIVGLLAFAISCFFISVYSDATESIYTTFCLDAEAGGQKGKCPDALAELLAEAERENHIESK